MADNPVWYDLTGIRRELVRVDDNSFAVTGSADVSPVLDANKEDNNHGSNWSRDRSWVLAARIPPIVYEIFLNKYGIDALNPDHKKGLIALLNSNEFRDLRVW